MGTGVAVAGLALGGVIFWGGVPRSGGGPEKPSNPPATQETATVASGSAQQPKAPPSVEPPPAPVVPRASGDRDETLKKLLYQGDVAFLEHRYMSPPEGSAVFAYLEALKLDPNNERARGQLARIVDDYLAWAEQALKQRNRGLALTYADKAAYIQRQALDVLSDPAIERRLAALRR